MKIITEETRSIANQRFQKMGLELTISKNSYECDDFLSSSIESRIFDLHAAFSDKNVKAIITTIGGFNSNQLLNHIDFNLIKKNPKILCGYSDITVLLNSIYAKTGLVTYYGPHYSTFGMKKGIEYTQEYFKKCLFKKKEYQILPSKKWNDDEWFKDQEKRHFVKNTGFGIFNTGFAKGKIVGGNLCTFLLLFGTEFRPKLDKSILFIEDDESTNRFWFDRNLQSLLQQEDFPKVNGIVIGRTQRKSNITDKVLEKILSTKKELDGIPVITRADFGHTSPMATFPIGGTIKVTAEKESAVIEIKEH